MRINSYVDEVRAKDSLSDRINFYRGKHVKKSNVDPVFKLPFRMLSEYKEQFANHVRNAWVRSSNYVHLTKRQMNQKIELREKGIVLGMDTIKMFKDVIAEVHEVCSIVMILAFESIGPSSFTGDILVDNFDRKSDWTFHANGYISFVDSYFDYKYERKDKLEELKQIRLNLVKYLAK